MKNGFEMGAQVPGGVYLCQVSKAVSCGACCGLYNVHQSDQQTLSKMLARRTDLFENTPRTPVSLDNFVNVLASMEPKTRPFPEFHHCPFLGLIGANRQCVGCLLHPMGKGNHGVDYRGMSYYGGMACRVFFCSTVIKLPGRYKHILREVAGDWYHYGLVVTETDLIAALLGTIETRLGQSLDPERIQHTPRVREALAALLTIKVDWPFRPADRNTACHYLFSDDLYPKPDIQYEHLRTPSSTLDTILFQLVSTFEDADQLREAELLVEERIEAVIHAYERGEASR